VAVTCDAIAAPNLTPYQPSGWSDKLVISTTTGTNTNSATLTPSSPLYLDWAVINNGSTSVTTQFWTTLYVDGSARTSWYSDPPLNSFYYVYLTDYALGTLASGTHTIRIVSDVYNAVAETNEFDNEYTRTIVVGAVNLKPYQPSGWSDEIVVSTVSGTHTDSGTLRPTDTLYVDWTVANLGTAATTARFHSQLYVDGVAFTSWYTDPPLDANTYSFVADYNLGTLSAGTHTLRIVVDSTAAIGESNELDNEYTKTITIANAQNVNLTPYKPGTWSDRIVVSTGTGTSTDSSTLTATDTLHIDWAVINNGSTATTAQFFSELYVDGTLSGSWYSDPPVDANSYVWVADHAIGPLSAGTHVLRIVTDTTGAISESSESDNEYTRTITVAGGGAADIRISPSTLTFNVAGDALDASADEPDPGTGPVNVAGLLARAERTGKIRVLVRLDIPFVPEGRLDVGGAERQRSAMATRADEVLQTLGLPAERMTRFETIPFVAMEVSAAELARLASISAVVGIEEDIPLPPTLASSNNVIGSGTAWAAGFTGTGQTVAVLDTGVDNTHPYFSTGTNKVVSEACYSSTTAFSSSVCPGGVAASTAAGSGRNCATSVSGCTHGTHVAGIVAGNDGIGPNFGVARDASVISIQVFSRFDSDSDCGTSPAPCVLTYTTDQIQGLERVYALRSTFQIAAANMSLGGGRFTATCDAANSAIKAAIDNLRSVGIATVIASGNDSYRDSIGQPACVSTAISVGATTDSDSVAGFSNVASFLSLLAPGVAITSSVPGGGTASFQGTSMAAPHVAGAWALMRQANPTADVPTILAALRSTATSVNDNRSSGTVTGMRRINVGAAVTAGGGQAFTIHNDGTAALTVSSIALDSSASWITWSPSAPFTIAAGTSRQVTVTVNSAGAPAGQSTRRLLVYSNDPDESPYPGAVDVVVNRAVTLPSVTITAGDSTATEAGPTTGTLTVTRSGSTTGSLTVHYGVGGSATAGSDYATLAGTVTIPSGASGSTITVTAIDDSIIENNETVVVTLASNAAYTVGSPGSGTVTIVSNDLPVVTVSASDPSASEAGPDSGTFVVTRSGPTSSSLTVACSLGGTAVNGSDYASLSGSVVIPAGAASAAIVVTPVADGASEGNETVILTAAASAAYQAGSPSSATITIADQVPLVAPANVLATATSDFVVNVNWSPVAGATSYRVYRSSDRFTYTLIGSAGAPPFDDTTATPYTAYLYKVRSYANGESGDSNRDLATTVMFMDETLTAGTTSVRLAHFTDLLSAVNAVRALAGLNAIQFSEPSPAAGVAVNGQHVVDLRNALNAARATIGLSALTYSDPTITAGATSIKAVHLTEIRNGVK
jgi:subtilisin